MVYRILFLLVLSCASTVAQNKRSQLKGIINSSTDDPMDGITVFNQNSLSGTVTNDEGVFYIDVREGDRLAFQAIQFEPFTLIVTQNTVEKKQITLTLNPGVNVLEEIEITGTSMLLELEPNKDYTPTLKKVSKSNVLIAANDRMSNTFSNRVRQPEEYSLRNNAFQQNIARFNSFNFFDLQRSALTSTSLQNMDLNILDGKKETKKENLLLENHFEKQYLMEFLDLKENELYPFMYFAQDEGLQKKMLQPENNTELLQFLSQQAKLFKNRGKSGTKVDSGK